MIHHFLLFTLLALTMGCADKKAQTSTNNSVKTSDISAYQGTASITQGIASTQAEAIYSCDRGRKTNIGKSPLLIKRMGCTCRNQLFEQ